MAGKSSSSDLVRVLVVDDNEDFCIAISQLLTLDGHVVLTAASGEEALRVMPAFEPHCVLLDVAMPGLNGLDLTRCLRRTYGDDIVLVAITGAEPGDPVAAETFMLVDHHLRKPVIASMLRQVMPRL